MPNLTILSKEIRQFDNLYCLNDLHKASGGEDRHKPKRFTRLGQTQELITEIEQGPDVALAMKVIHGGNLRGTYACKQIVLSYGMWVSPKLNLAVINAFLDQQEQQPQLSPQSHALTPTQQRHIQERVAEIVKSGMFGFTYQSLYSKIKTRFQVGTYKDIPQERYPELCKCLRCKPKIVTPHIQPQIPPLELPDGRYLVIKSDGDTRIRDVGKHNLINNEHILILRRNFKLLSDQMRILLGEQNQSVMELPLEEL